MPQRPSEKIPGKSGSSIFQKTFGDDQNPYKGHQLESGVGSPSVTLLLHWSHSNKFTPSANQTRPIPPNSITAGSNYSQCTPSQTWARRACTALACEDILLSASAVAHCFHGHYMPYILMFQT